MERAGSGENGGEEGFPIFIGGAASRWTRRDQVSSLCGSLETVATDLWRLWQQIFGGKQTDLAQEENDRRDNICSEQQLQYIERPPQKFRKSTKSYIFFKFDIEKREEKSL